MIFQKGKRCAWCRVLGMCFYSIGVDDWFCCLSCERHRHEIDWNTHHPKDWRPQADA